MSVFSEISRLRAVVNDHDLVAFASSKHFTCDLRTLKKRRANIRLATLHGQENFIERNLATRLWIAFELLKHQRLPLGY